MNSDNNDICIFAKATSSDVSNSEYLRIGWDTTDYVISSNKIGTGVVTLVTVATNDFSGVGVTVSLPSANTNEIKISFSGFHSNNHGWECYIKTEY